MIVLFVFLFDEVYRFVRFILNGIIDVRVQDGWKARESDIEINYIIFITDNRFSSTMQSWHCVGEVFFFASFVFYVECELC